MKRTAESKDRREEQLRDPDEQLQQAAEFPENNGAPCVPELPRRHLSQGQEEADPTVN